LAELALAPRACGETPTALAVRGLLTKAAVAATSPMARPAVKPAIEFFLAAFYSCNGY
jgi:hypothetical protein